MFILGKRKLLSIEESETSFNDANKYIKSVKKLEVYGTNQTVKGDSESSNTKIQEHLIEFSYLAYDVENENAETNDGDDNSVKFQKRKLLAVEDKKEAKTVKKTQQKVIKKNAEPVKTIAKDPFQEKLEKFVGVQKPKVGWAYRYRINRYAQETGNYVPTDEDYELAKLKQRELEKAAKLSEETYVEEFEKPKVGWEYRYRITKWKEDNPDKVKELKKLAASESKDNKKDIQEKKQKKKSKKNDDCEENPNTIVFGRFRLDKNKIGKVGWEYRYRISKKLNQLLENSNGKTVDKGPDNLIPIEIVDYLDDPQIPYCDQVLDDGGIRGAWCDKRRRVDDDDDDDDDDADDDEDDAEEEKEIKPKVGWEYRYRISKMMEAKGIKIEPKVEKAKAEKKAKSRDGFSKDTIKRKSSNRYDENTEEENLFSPELKPKVGWEYRYRIQRKIDAENSNPNLKKTSDQVISEKYKNVLEKARQEKLEKEKLVPAGENLNTHNIGWEYRYRLSRKLEALQNNIEALQNETKSVKELITKKENSTPEDKKISKKEPKHQEPVKKDFKKASKKEDSVKEDVKKQEQPVIKKEIKKDEPAKKSVVKNEEPKGVKLEPKKEVPTKNLPKKEEPLEKEPAKAEKKVEAKIEPAKKELKKESGKVEAAKKEFEPKKEEKKRPEPIKKELKKEPTPQTAHETVTEDKKDAQKLTKNDGKETKTNIENERVKKIEEPTNVDKSEAKKEEVGIFFFKILNYLPKFIINILCLHTDRYPEVCVVKQPESEAIKQQEVIEPEKPKIEPPEIKSTSLPTKQEKEKLEIKKKPPVNKKINQPTKVTAKLKPENAPTIIFADNYKKISKNSPAMRIEKVANKKDLKELEHQSNLLQRLQMVIEKSRQIENKEPSKLSLEKLKPLKIKTSAGDKIKSESVVNQKTKKKVAQEKTEEKKEVQNSIKKSIQKEEILKNDFLKEETEVDNELQNENPDSEITGTNESNQVVSNPDKNEEVFVEGEDDENVEEEGEEEEEEEEDKEDDDEKEIGEEKIIQELSEQFESLNKKSEIKEELAKEVKNIIQELKEDMKKDLIEKQKKEVEKKFQTKNEEKTENKNEEKKQIFSFNILTSIKQVLSKMPSILEIDGFDIEEQVRELEENYEIENESNTESESDDVELESDSNDEEEDQNEDDSDRDDTSGEESDDEDLNGLNENDEDETDNNE